MCISELVSWSRTRAECTTRQTVVGTLVQLVTRSRSIVASVSSGSKRPGCQITVEPAARPPGVGPDGDRAERHRRPERRDPLDRVAAEDRDPVALADTLLGQPARDPADSSVMGGVANSSLTVDEVVTITELERRVEQRAQR